MMKIMKWLNLLKNIYFLDFYNFSKYIQKIRGRKLGYDSCHLFIMLTLQSLVKSFV